MDVDAPLDFELEDPLVDVPPPAARAKRKKIIDLDELLTEHYKEEHKSAERDHKRKTRCYDSDEDEDRSRKKKERELSKLVDSCQKQVYDMGVEVDVPLWGLNIFGCQKKQPLPISFDLKRCKLLNNFSEIKVLSTLDLDLEKGEDFLEGLLKNGWLLKLVCTCGYVEDSLACWMFKQMLYSSSEDLHSSACGFWCNLLSNKVGEPSLKLNWLPSYSDIMGALEIYGYDHSLLTKLADDASTYEGPPLNIKSWIKFVTAVCQSRDKCSIFSSSEVEELLPVVISFFLDRQLQGILMLLDECVKSVVSFFTEDEWHISCVKMAEFTARSVPKDLNCLRIVECVPQDDDRSRILRSQLAFQILIHSFEKPVSSGMEILEILSSINMKEKHCDFVKLYIYLVLVENWLCFDAPQEKSSVLNMWCKYLRNCSTQITSTDWRPYASKVRNRASYLIQTANQVLC